jgi:hypothetical protein
MGKHNGKRRSARIKEDLVLRLMRGEDLETVARESGTPLHELSDWRDKYMLAGREGLKSKPGDPLGEELRAARDLIAKQALELEILGKAQALAASRRR